MLENKIAKILYKNLKLLKNLDIIILFILILKIIFLGLFSSEYQNLLFMPFVNHFVQFHDNSWQWVYETKVNIEFPYYPLMLYVFSIGMVLIKSFHISNVFFVNIFFKIPLLIADFVIFYLFLKITKNKKMSILFYFCSPIILYATFMHSQLDILPVAVLFYSIYLLKKQKIYQASILFIISCCFKMTAVLFLPIFLIYMFKNGYKLKIILSSVIMFFIYIAITVPYIFSKGYQNLVILNNKQNLFFNLHISLEQVAIYIPLLLTILIYLKFASYKKINNSLLDAFCCLISSIFLIFVPPSSPAWFIWLVPFLSLFVINYRDKNITYVYLFLNISYLIYFVFFHIGDYGDLTFLTQNIDLKINNLFLKNCIFTVLISSIISIIYLTYKIAIKNNSIYKKEKAILIGISGDSGSGKTTLLGDLQHLLTNNLLTLEGDGAHKWIRGDENWEIFTPLNPKANSLHEQLEKIATLKMFKTISYREYNHNTGKFKILKKIEPKQFIVLAGLHTFYLPKMRKLIDLKIFLNTQKDLQLHWKKERDVKERGYNLEDIEKSISLRNDDSLKYITPQKYFADFIITYFFNKNTIQESAQDNLGLRIDIDSSLSLESILKYLKNKGVSYEWDYTEDLNFQYIIFNSQIGINISNDFINKHIENIDEILDSNFELEKGYRGFVQYLVIKFLSEKMKGDND